MGKIVKFLFSKLFFIGVLMLIQGVILIGTLVLVSENFSYVYLAFVLLSVIMVVYIVNQDADASVKLPWVIAIMLLPVFGGLFYILFGRTYLTKKSVAAFIRARGTESCFEKRPENLAAIKAENPVAAMQFSYLAKMGDTPVYTNTKTTFLSPGETKFERMLLELERGEKFIFLEYFIIQEGKMWNTILEILARKAAQGVDVRVMYDDFGCLFLLPEGYRAKLESLGIKCIIFNQLRPALNPALQNRDHRKILVVDGKIGFTGGVNLADEYINAYERFGYWKDASILFEGEAVWSLTLMFLQMWNLNSKVDDNYRKFHVDYKGETDGYVQIYGDLPFDRELVGESVYLNMINGAQKYLYIETPYFVVDNQMMTALGLAAKRGVDVRIITPKKWDKWYVHIITRAHYSALIGMGVKVYEFTPGFIHSKVLICDDILGTVGTINMDYRSFRHHFECGSLLYKCGAIGEMKKDFDDILRQSKQITEEDCKKTPRYIRYLRGILRIFAPLM